MPKVARRLRSREASFPRPPLIEQGRRTPRERARSGCGQALVGSAALAACSIFAQWLFQ